MSRYPLRAGTWGCLLVVAAAFAAHGQTPQSRRTTSAVGQLGLDDAPTAPAGVGRLRELRCRGKQGMELRVHQDPSPRVPALVAMELRYERPKLTRSVGQEGMGTVDYGVTNAILPGTCAWNPLGSPDVPPEPGVVYFDLQRDAQAWLSPSDRDTTINAAVNFPDVASLSRYLDDPERYWIFYVDDVTAVSISFGAWPRGGGLPPPSTAGNAPSPTDHSLGTSRDQRTSDAGTRSPTSPAGTVAGPLRDASPDRVAPERPAGGGAPAASPIPHPGDSAVNPSRPIDKASASRKSPATPGTSRLEDARSDRKVQLASGIRDVTVTPGPRGVRLSFHTHRGAHARVQFSKQPPRWDQREGYWEYPPGWGSPWYARIEHPFGSTAYEAVPMHTLESGARYHYLITIDAKEGSPPERQRTGSFTARVER